MVRSASVTDGLRAPHKETSTRWVSGRSRRIPLGVTLPPPFAEQREQQHQPLLNERAAHDQRFGQQPMRRAGRAAQQCSGNCRRPADPPAEIAVEECDTRWGERVVRGLAAQTQLRHVPRPDEIVGADQPADTTVTGLERYEDQTVKNQQSKPPFRLRRHSRQVERAGVETDHFRAKAPRHLARERGTALPKLCIELYHRAPLVRRSSPGVTGAATPGSDAQTLRPRRLCSVLQAFAVPPPDVLAEILISQSFLAFAEAPAVGMSV
jgi:hypothetical protein